MSKKINKRNIVRKNQSRLVKFAYRHLGKPYKYGAKSYEAPKYFDCSSFVQYLYKRIGIDLPRCSIDQALCGRAVRSKIPLGPPFRKGEGNLQIGDLIFIKGPWGRYNPKFPKGVGHVVIYVGKGRVIHAKSRKVGGKEIGRVIEAPVEKILKRDDLRVAKRIL